MSRDQPLQWNVKDLSRRVLSSRHTLGSIESGSSSPTRRSRPASTSLTSGDNSPAKHGLGEASAALASVSAQQGIADQEHLLCEVRELLREQSREILSEMHDMFRKQDGVDLKRHADMERQITGDMERQLSADLPSAVRRVSFQSEGSSADVSEPPKVAAQETVCECGNIFLGDAVFCRKCGKARPGVCSCGNICAVDALFCRKCGKPREEGSKAIDATRAGRKFRKSLTTPLLGDTPAEEVKKKKRMPKREPTQLQRLVTNPKFDLFMGGWIVVNAMFIGYSSNYEVAHPYNTSNALIRRVSFGFNLFFLCEILLRSATVGCGEYFTGNDMGWNILDCFIIFLSFFSSISKDLFDFTAMPNMSLFRLLRLVRLVRVFKVMRAAYFLRELRTLLTSIVSSLRILFWSVLMIMLIYYMFALVFLQAVGDALPDPEVESALKDKLVVHYGSVYRCMLTLYLSITGGLDWGPVSELLIPIGMGYYFVYLFFISFINIAILNVVTGSFVDATMKAAVHDRMEEMKEAVHELDMFRDSILSFFSELDETPNHDGLIDEHGLEASFGHEAMQTFLKHVEYHPQEALTLFRVLQEEASKDGDDGKVHINVFVDACLKLGRKAKGLDIMVLMEQNEAILSRLDQAENCHRLSGSDMMS